MSKEIVRTIADIARLAGVSKSTVSRALNDSPLIGEDTKSRIRELAKKHNFQINLKLWHEVWVVPGSHLHLEYHNCHPATGLLPWFEVEELKSQ